MSWVLSWMWLMGFFISHRRRAWYAREKNVVFIVSLLYVFSWRWIWILKMDIDRGFKSDYERLFSCLHVFSPSFFSSLSILAKKKQSDCFLSFFFFLIFSLSFSVSFFLSCWLACSIWIVVDWYVTWISLSYVLLTRASYLVSSLRLSCLWCTHTRGRRKKESNKEEKKKFVKCIM